MEIVTAEIWEEGGAMAAAGVAVMFRDDLRAGSFEMPPHKFLRGRYATIKADDGRSCVVMARPLPWDVLSGEPQSFTFAGKESAQLG